MEDLYWFVYDLLGSTASLTVLITQLIPLKKAIPTPVMMPSSMRLIAVVVSAGMNSFNSSNIHFHLHTNEFGESGDARSTVDNSLADRAWVYLHP